MEFRMKTYICDLQNFAVLQLYMSSPYSQYLYYKQSTMIPFYLLFGGIVAGSLLMSHVF